MEKSALVLALSALVAFLLPVGVYCLFLASINRRSQPVLANGIWDAIGLLCAASGFLLVTVPMLFTEFYRRTATVIDSDQLIAIWLSQWALWLAYFLLLVSGAWLMVIWRRNKTLIYNVDLEIFLRALEQTFAALGLEARRNSAKLVLVPAKPHAGDASTAFTEAAPRPANPANERRHAEVEIESFPSMCHVTLHWGKCTANLRQDIERELHKNLEGAAPLENPAAGWFMTVSGLVLGAVTSIALAMALLLILTAR